MTTDARDRMHRPSHRAAEMAQDLVAEATGRGRRVDPVLPGMGGPAGNTRLTAWTGLILLGLGVVEVVTLIDVRGLLSWHLFFGALLVPLAVLKTATTTWRFARYYAENRPYREAGPPPMVLRALGPLVVMCTLALLGSGFLLTLIGPQTSRNTVVSLLGQRVDWVTVHQAAFVAWAVAVGIHVLARIVPALRVVGVRRADRAAASQQAGVVRRVPGTGRRGVVLAAALLAAVLLALLTLHLGGAWQTSDRSGPPLPPATATGLGG